MDRSEAGIPGECPGCKTPAACRVHEECLAPPPPAEQASGQHVGRLDPTTYEQIEAALDRAEAPSRDASGRWLPLAERVAALSQRPVVLNSPPPPAEQASGEVDARVRDGEKLLATLPQRWLIVIDRLNYMIARDASGIDVIKSARGNDEAEFLAMVIALSQQQVVDEARIERIVRAAISKHCPEGKWLTGPNTLAMSIAFRVYEALAPQQPTGEENSDAAR